MNRVETPTLGTLLRRYRLSAGLTQDELAERAGVSARSVSDIERGISLVPQRGTIDRLADALQLESEERSAFGKAARRPGTRGSRSESAPSARSSVGSGGPTLPSMGRIPYGLHITNWVPITRPKFIAAAVAGVGLAALALALFGHDSSPGHARVLSASFSPWGWMPARPAQLNAPSSTAVDAQGNLFVADTGNDRIVKVSSAGRLLASWTNSASRRGRFASPEGVAVDSHGHVFVADTGNSRIVELSPAGTQLTQWTGDAYGLYVHPTAIAVDAHGEILVVDTRYNCITLVQSTSHDIWCGYDVQGLISFVVAGVAVDPHGNVYASDANTGRVVRLRSSLGPHLLHEWRVASPSGGRPVHLAGLAPDRQGNLYVVDGSNNQVSKLSSTGRRLGSWKFFGSPAGLLAGPSGLTVDRQGAVYVAVSGNDSVQKIVPANGSVAVWTRLDPPAARVDEPHAVSIDSKGDVFVITGSARNHILKFSSHGTLLSDWGPSALRQAGMYVLTGLATDLRGNVYASDAFNDRIYKLSGSGGLLAVWKVKVSTQSAPYGIALDGSGNIYVADMGDQALKKLSPQGRYLGQAILPALPNWAINETCSNCAPTDQQVITPREVAVGRNGVAYLLDSDHHIVVKLSSSRKVLRLWGSKESTSAALKDPVRLALDKRGNVFVLDAAQNKVFEFSPQGDLLARWGAKGSKPGHLLSPDGIAVDRSGNVYVADTGNNRLQKLTRTR